jgi:hypothetical protein
MRAFFIVAGVLFVVILLTSTGAMQGQVCVHDLGCLRSSASGLSLGK